MNYNGHYSVLLNETLNLLGTLPGESLIIDATLGEGGHSLAILQQFDHPKLIAIDADALMIARATHRLNHYHSQITFVNDWFDHFFDNYPASFSKPQAILMDLGISMFHYARSERGFSLRGDELLDMRLEAIGESAADLVNNLDTKELSLIFSRYGQEKKSYQIATAIVAYRQKKKITKSNELADIIRGCFGGKPLPHHPATRSFQALRIAVNDELGHLHRGLAGAWNLLPLGGRLAVISFHSLEDRIVKQFMATKTMSCRCPPHVLKCRCGGAVGNLINKGGTTAGDQELQQNPASRSARLRVIEKMVQD